MKSVTPDFSRLYALLHDAVCNRAFDDLKSILQDLPRSVIAQLRYDGTTPTAIINMAILRRYHQLHGRIDQHNDIVEIPAVSSSAGRKQDFEAVKLLLYYGFGPEDIGPGELNYGPQTISPVQLAAETDDLEILQLLLNAGANPKSHYRDSIHAPGAFYYSGPPLQSAAANGSLATLQFLITWSQEQPNKFPLSETDKKNSLIASAWFVSQGTLQTLLSYFTFPQTVLSRAMGDAVEPCNVYGDSLYRLPVVHRTETDRWTAQVEIVQKLLEAGADPNYIIGRSENETVLREAIYRAKGPEIVRLLMDHGASLDQREEALALLALNNGNTELVKIFLDLGLIPSQFTVFSRFHSEKVPCTPLHVAAPHAPVETLKLLVSAGFDPLTRDANGWTVFHYACKDRRVDNLKYLLGFNPNAVKELTPDGWSPLTIGLESATYLDEGAPYLIEQGANINAPSPEPPNYSPVHLAAEGGCWDLLELLLERGALITKVEETGETAIHFMDWDEETCRGTKSLLAHGANINAQDNEGTTLLHKLFRNPRPYQKDTVKFVLKSGADLSIKDNRGKTPRDLNDELPEYRRWKDLD